jgi:zinc transport system ATP-binding protein
VSENVVEIENLFFSYNSKDWALQDINITIKRNEFIGIIGPNGGGKTTFVKLLLGILKPNEGKIKLFGLSNKEGRKKIGYFPQIKGIDQDFPITVYEVILGARLKDKLINFYTSEDHEVVEEVMKTLDITELRDRKLDELSGGQRNRVFLARALACEPEMLVLDEPMAGLDTRLQRMFMETLKSLNRTKTILIVDHNVSLLKEYVDGFLCMNRCISHGIMSHTAANVPKIALTEHEHQEVA